MKSLFLGLLGVAAVAAYVIFSKKTRPGFVEVRKSELDGLKSTLDQLIKECDAQKGLEQKARVRGGDDDADPRFYRPSDKPPVSYH